MYTLHLLPLVNSKRVSNVQLGTVTMRHKKMERKNYINKGGDALEEGSIFYNKAVLQFNSSTNTNHQNTTRSVVKVDQKCSLIDAKK